MSWMKVGTLNDIPVRGARTVESSAGQLAVFRTGDDYVFALLNRCPHKNGPLSEGIVAGHAIICPLHGWTIDLSSGEAAAPDEGCTPPVPVRKDDDGSLWLDLSALPAAAAGAHHG